MKKIVVLVRDNKTRIKRYMKKAILSILFGLTFVSLWAQPSNSDCINALEILDPIEYCSGETQFNNFNAGSDNYNAPDCWLNDNNDVWFKFTAFAKAINIIVEGSAGAGSLGNPEVALYVDNGCFGTIEQLRCASDAAGNGIISIFRGGLTIGQSFLIRVDGRANTQGTFQLCISNYNPPVEPGQDCVDGAILCDKSPFVVQSVTGAGLDTDEAANTCLGTLVVDSESQSTWFKWTAATSGTLTFTLSPLKTTDDLDFVLYELPNGVFDCTGKISLRCNATFGGDGVPCGPLTGLDLTSTEFEEDSNCDPGEDGFVRFIDMEAGKSYALVVNNFTESGIGFGVEFGGTGTFLGPEPDFTIDPPSGLKCDTDFMITDQSSFPNGSIIGYEWNFGAGASPETAATEGPHSVNFFSFGDKFITLTVETDRGCIVTQVLPLYVEPCCEDLEDIGINVLEVNNIICAGEAAGSILVEGFGGTPPDYQYNIDDGNYSLNPGFQGLEAGSYEIGIIDPKGCMDSIIVTLDEPEPLTVDAGPDITVDLGYGANINATYTPFGAGIDIFWTPPEGLSCTDCLDPFVIPPGMQTYYIAIEDASGCQAVDSLTIFVEVNRPLFAPNIFSTNQGSFNNYFNLFSGPAGLITEELYIFDRWGNLVYQGQNIPLNDRGSGWDGTFKNKLVNPGVFAWLAKVRYIDDELVTFTGDVTVVR